MAISEDDLRGLSAVERETLLAAEADDTDGDIARELGQPAPRDDAPPAKAAKEVPGDGEEDPDEEAAAAAAAAAPAPAAAPAAPKEGEGAGAEGAAAAEEEAEPDAPPHRSTPADIDDQRKALRAEKAEAMQKLLDGETTQAEYQAVEDRVQDKLDALLRAEASDQAAVSIERAGMMRDYNADLRDTQKELKAAGLDCKGDEKLKSEFDRAVRLFAQEAEEDGLSDVPGNLAASKRALDEAKALMLRRHGKAAAAPAPAPVAPKSTTTTAAGPRPPADRSKIPPTLAGVPVASDARITSEFAHLEGIDNPADLERELAKMTPQQQERYLDA
ncbi:hypothetical protein LJR130_003793 [Variovorax sp. LjRoot130]|uniref:hypothetical protein n=1 Tax=Variovorax sp. LjRoot130 TaxID=3342261 RepID=UPI003ECFA822